MKILKMLKNQVRLTLCEIMDRFEYTKKRTCKDTVDTVVAVKE